MNRRILLILPVILSACDKKESTSGTGTSVTVDFKREAFQSTDGRYKLALISGSEAEYTIDGTTHLSQYTKSDGKVRLVVSAFGGKEVIYFKEKQGSLHGEDGKMLLAASQLAAFREEQRLAEQNEAERQRKAKEQKAKEAQRLAEALNTSRKPTKIIGEFKVKGPRDSRPLSTIYVSDVGASFSKTGEVEFLFSDYWRWGMNDYTFYNLYFQEVLPPTARMSVGAPYEVSLEFLSQNDCDSFHIAFFDAYKAWAKLHPEVVKMYSGRQVP